jgi:protein-tyrosine phosphatase
VSIEVDRKIIIANHFSWITPTLAVGDFFASKPPQCWEIFSSILNICETQHQNIYPSDAYLWLPIRDGDREGFEKIVDQALDFLLMHEYEPTLVHCAAGISRSVSIAMAFLCQQRNISTSQELEDVYDFIQKYRCEAFPAQVFVDAIAQRHGVAAPLIGW